MKIDFAIDYFKKNDSSATEICSYQTPNMMRRTQEHSFNRIFQANNLLLGRKSTFLMPAYSLPVCILSIQKVWRSGGKGSNNQ